MIHWTEADSQMLVHVVDVIGDRMGSEDGYTEQDEATMVKLKALSKMGPAVTVAGDDLDEDARKSLFTEVVNAELDNWIPNASQRLLFRAGAALGQHHPGAKPTDAEDCGPSRAQHALILGWLASVYVHQCATCLRLYRA